MARPCATISLAHRGITQAEFDKADALYRDVMVNCYHGIRACLNPVGRKSD